MLKKIRSFLFKVIFALWTLFYALLALPFSLFLSHKQLTSFMAMWAKGTMFLVRVLCGIRYEIRGREHLPEGACIIASKHQSEWETIVFLAELKYTTYILKKELLKIPLVGWHMVHMGQIPIDRTQGASALKKMARQVRQAIDKGRIVVIFPEGTRTLPGSTPKYRSGIVGIYKELGSEVPIIPMALNSGYFWQHKNYLKNPGTIIAEFLPAMPTDLEGKIFLSELEEKIEAASDSLSRF